MLLKLESLQLTGSFKIRGAWTRLVRGRTVALVISGGNVDAGLFSALLQAPAGAGAVR